MLSKQSVLYWVIPDALVAADRDPPGIAEDRQPHRVRRLRMDLWAATLARMHNVLAHVQAFSDLTCEDPVGRVGLEPTT
jgi:hypothetical protein